MKNSTVFSILILSMAFLGCSQNQQLIPKVKVKTGAEVLLDNHLQDLKNKKVGLVMNPTSLVDGVHMLDTLLQSDINITALFAAEHGFRGEAGAGEKISDGIDQQTGIPVHSLYGETRKPTSEMLKEVDIILFDLPDVGARFYTYSSTMGYVLEAATENNKEMWILDRPNPLGGNYVSGWILEDRFKSFVGSYPMPIAYGLTMGEIATMAVGEQWLNLEKEPQLKIVKAEGWERDMKWPDTGLQWIVPSPNLPTFEHAFAYVGTVIFEGTNLSEGRGTEDPFLTIGSPHMNFTTKDLEELEVKFNVQLDSVSFTPKAIPGKAINPKLKDVECTGVKISWNDNYQKADPVEFGLALLNFAKKHTHDFEVKEFANKLFGIDIKTLLESNEPLPGWEEETEAFKKQREPYLLYD
ncbi:MAG: DUF1343 domain-containing protein [Balneolaceae bacterium]